MRFDYLLVLVGVVLGLGITQVLTGFANLIQHRNRVKAYWVQALWMALMFLLQVEHWYTVQQWREVVGLGDEFFAYLATLFVPFTLFITTVVIVPAIPPEGEFDCRADYYQNARWTFSLATACIVVIAVHKTLHVGGHWLDPRNAIRGAAALVTAGLAFSRRPWLHAAAPAVLGAMFGAFVWLYADR